MLYKGIRAISFQKKIRFKPGTVLIETVLSGDPLYNGQFVIFYLVCIQFSALGRKFIKLVEQDTGVHFLAFKM